MNRIPTLRSKTNPLAAAILTGAILAIPTLHAQEFTWNNITGNWSTPANWDDGAAPTNNEPAGVLRFGGDGETGYIATNDILPDTGFTYHRLVLDSIATVTNTLTTSRTGLLQFVANNANPGAIVQEGTGAFQIDLPIVVNEPLLLAGTANAGRVTFGRAITGAGAIEINQGDWKFSGANSAWTGTTTISGGAKVLVQPTAGAPGAAVNLSLSGANSLFGASGTIAINNGTLKLSPIEAGNINLGDTRTLAFGALGGVVDIVNTTGGNIAGGNFAVTTTAGATEPAVIKFNGGANGLMENSTTNGNWNAGANALRLRSVSGSGPLRVELSNGAAMRLGTGASNNVTVATPLTIRGVFGGDPTSQDAVRNSAIARNTGRLVADNFSTLTHSGGLVLENALQVHGANASRALDGNITIAGTTSGNPGFVAFSGRGTGTNLGATVNAPGVSTVGQNVLWIGRDNNDTLTIQDGGTAVLDARMRYDQKNHHGVLLNANAAIEGGGTLRFYQSLSNASGSVEANRQGQTVNTVANVGNHIVQGDLIGTGNSTRDAAVDLYLPVGEAITAEVTGDDSKRPYGGVVFENTSDLVVNGSGFGGLRINGFARANALFANNTPDTVSNVDKVNNLLTTARISNLTGSGGYLTVAPANETYVFPNAEWAPGVTVGLKVVNQNPNGVDLRFNAAKTSWGHNLAIGDGATFDTGATPFTLSAGTLQGIGNVTGSGLIIGTGGTINAGLGGVGALSVTNLTIGGTFAGDVSGATNDIVHVAGNLTLDAGSTFRLAGGAPVMDRTTFLTYTGTLTGAFTNIIDAPVGATVNTDIPGRVRLVLDTINERVWEGSPATVWSTTPADANWEGGVAFANGDQVLFDDTATSKTVTISGVVQPDLLTVSGPANYTISGTATDYIGGDAALVKEGSGSVTLSGSHTYSSGTTLREGTLIVGGNNTLPDAGAVFIRNSATLDLGGFSDTVGQVTVAGKIQNGTLTAGPIRVENAATIGANLVLTGNLTKTEAGSSAISGNVDLGAANRTLDVTGVLAIGGVVSNGTLTKTGAGTLELSGLNTHTGGTNVTAGTLRATGTQVLAGGSLAVAAGATADLNGFDQSTTALSGAGTVALGEATLTVNGSTTSTFSGVISGAGDLAKAGTGVLTLSSANTFSGGLSVEGGRVNLTNATAAGTGLITVKDGGALQLGQAIANNIQFDGGVLSSQSGSNQNGIWTVNADTEVRSYNQDSNASTDIIHTGILKGTGDINFFGSPTVTNADAGQGLRFRGTAASDYSGTIIANKKTKLEIQVASSAGSNPIGTGKIQMVAGSSTGGLNGDYSQLQPRNVTANQTHVFGSDVEIVGQGYVNVNVLGEANTVSQFGELTIGDGQILGASKNDTTIRTVEFASVNLTGGLAEVRAYDPGFGVSTNNSRGGSDIRLGDIGESEAGAGIITKSGGTNVVEIVGEATYTGPTHIDGGTLRVSANGSIESSSEVRIAAGAKLDVLAHTEGYSIPEDQTLSGSGEWDGSIVFSGTLAPGSGVGTLTGDNFTLAGTAALQFELAASEVSDRLVLTGAFNQGAPGAFQFDFGGTGFEGVYTLVQFASTTFTAEDFSLAGLAPGLTGTFQMTDTSLQLAVVPEPGSVIALALGGALLGMRRRRRA